MPTLKSRPPRLCRHRMPGRKDQAYVRLNGDKIYLGLWGTEAMRRRYAEIIRRWTLAEDLPVQWPTVWQLSFDFDEHAEQRYSRQQVHRFKTAIKFLNRQCGSELRTDRLQLPHLANARDAMLSATTAKGQPYSRGYVRSLTSCILTVVRWGVNRGKVPASVLAELNALEPLRAGEGRQTLPSRAIEEKWLEACPTWRLRLSP